MAKIDAVWGIDIGQCGVKALRCRVNEQPDRLTAEAFDYIEYPKILSQPEADPVELIRDALKQFLSRNSVKGDRVAISVPGQNGLARFIKLPPVESRKVPDIVKYEARQQIPFPLDDVVWDYQQMAGGSEEDGFVLETEVGLFAMKREQVARALSPFDDAGIEVDIVQLTPLALYNYIAFDQLHKLPPPDQYDPESPPESLVVLSLGTETTDLVVTNGYRVWQRSIPLGGSHFTKALSKELKLTYPKAEHLKRNASSAENPKAIFQAMRPVFNDLVTEVQRSIGYFTNIDRRAKIARIISLGSAMKLPGLQRYLQQNLGMEIDRVEAFRGLSGTSVVEAPIFKENILAFGVCYGLCVQGLREARIKTNLIPPEIVTDRMIRAKKPWAVAAAACLLIGLAASFGGHYKAWNSVHDDKFGSVKSQADAVASESSNFKQQFTDQETKFKTVNSIGDVLVSNIDGRLMWLEVLKAINQTLPRDEGQPPEDIHARNELHITQIQCQKVPNLASWYAIAGEHDPDRPADFVPAAGAMPVDPCMSCDPCSACNPCAVPMDAAPAVDPSLAGDPAAAGSYGPSGEGWVFQIVGYHYHNKEGDRQDFGAQYLRRVFLDRLKKGSIDLMAIGNRPAETLAIKDLGISHPILINPGRVYDHYVPDENAEPPKPGAVAGGLGGGLGAGLGAGLGLGMGMGEAGQGNTPMKKLRRFDFVIQFAWQETPYTKRLEKKKAQLQQQQQAQPDGEIPAEPEPDVNAAAALGGQL